MNKSIIYIKFFIDAHVSIVGCLFDVNFSKFVTDRPDGCSAKAANDFPFNIVFKTYDFLKRVITMFMNTFQLTIFAFLLIIKSSKWTFSEKLRRERNMAEN